MADGSLILTASVRLSPCARWYSNGGGAGGYVPRNYAASTHYRAIADVDALEHGDVRPQPDARADAGRSLDKRQVCRALTSGCAVVMVSQVAVRADHHIFANLQTMRGVENGVTVDVSTRPDANLPGSGRSGSYQRNAVIQRDTVLKQDISGVAGNIDGTQAHSSTNIHTAQPEPENAPTREHTGKELGDGFRAIHGDYARLALPLSRILPSPFNFPQAQGKMCSQVPGRPKSTANLYSSTTASFNISMPRVRPSTRVVT